jgi:hypothetical protein
MGKPSAFDIQNYRYTPPAKKPIPKGPRNAGLFVYYGLVDDKNKYIADIAESNVTAPLANGTNWNVGGLAFDEMPTTGLKKKIYDQTMLSFEPSAKANMRGGYMDKDTKAYKRNKVTADNMNTDVYNDFVGVMPENAHGDARTTTTYSPFGGESLGAHITYKPSTIKDYEYFSNTVVPHELQHGLGTVKGQLFDNRATSAFDNKSPYDDRLGERIAYMTNGRVDFPEELTSADSEYGIHPFIGFDKKTGTFNNKPGLAFLKGHVNTGLYTNTQNKETLNKVNKRIKELNEKFKKDPKFKAIVNKAFSR